MSLTGEIDQITVRDDLMCSLLATLRSNTCRVCRQGVGGLAKPLRLAAFHARLFRDRWIARGCRSPLLGRVCHHCLTECSEGHVQGDELDRATWLRRLENCHSGQRTAFRRFPAAPICADQRFGKSP